jgi:CubicO group peptidase (beta-lactamase class C family)
MRIHSICHTSAFIMLVAVYLPVSSFGKTTRSLSPADGPENDNQNVASDSERFEEVRARIVALVESGEIPSMAVAVAKDGRIVWEEAFGWADREKGIEATPNTVYAIGSLSKSITGTAVMVLVDRGMIRLDDPLYPYLGPATPVDHLGVGSAISVRQIITMTGGIPHLWLQPTNTDDPLPSLTTTELIARYGFSMSPPGETFNYSNLSFAFPELIISKVTGKSFADFMESEVFLPLGMTHSSVNPRPEQREHLARGYNAENDPFPVDIEFYPKGGGGMYSSVRDLIRYGLFHLKESPETGTRIMKSPTIDTIHRAENPELPNYRRYSLGWGLVNDGKHFTLVSDGQIAGANSMLLLLPDERIAIVCLANITGVISMMTAMQIADELLPGYMGDMMDYIGTMESIESPAVSFAVTPELLGTWRGEIRTYEGEIPLTLTFSRGDSVLARIGSTPPARLTDVRYVDRPDTVVNNVRFRYRILRGNLEGMINTKDTADRDHYVALKLEYYNGRFVGVASAIGEGFSFPSFVSLGKDD